MLLHLLRALGIRLPEHPAITPLRSLSEQLTEFGTDYRETASRVALLRQREGFLRADAAAWERRRDSVRRSGNLLLLEACSEICGRVAERLDSTRAELDVLEPRERDLRKLLVTERKRWARLVSEADRMGLDTSECVLHVDLQAPPPPADLDLLNEDTEHAEYVARVIDGMRVH